MILFRTILSRLAMKSLQLTLALVKPDIAANIRLVKEIEKRIVKKNFFIVKRKCVRWNKRNAEEFYKEHSGRFFHRRLVEFMSSGPVIALVLARENAIVEWRKLMGPTKVYQTRFTNPNTIRGRFGLTDTRNTVHGSDSKQSVLNETALFFPEFDVSKWFLDEEHLFCKNQVTFDEQRGVHVLKTNDVSSRSKGSWTEHMGEPQVWSDFYEGKTEPMDWFAGFDEMEDYLAALMHENKTYKTIVDVGCGSSLLGPKLAEAKPHLDVYCMDISEKCLLALSGYHYSENCTYVIGDIRQYLPFEGHSVDLIIDKGTTDAITRHEKGPQNLTSMFREIQRVLNKDGALLQITTEVPETRLDLLHSIDLVKSVSYMQLTCVSNNLPVYSYTVQFY